MKKHLLRLWTLALLAVVSTSLQAQDVTAEWNFKDDLPKGIQEATNYQGVEADIPSTVEGIVMHVNAKSGKLYCVGRDNAQMNPGTILQVPVKSTKDVVTVSGYPGYSHYAINGTPATEAETSHTATAAEVAKGYVEVTATESNNYIYWVKVVQAASSGKNLIEKSLYKTDFTDWELIDRTKATNVTKTVTTKFTNEALTFTLTGIGADPEGNNSKFATYTGYMVSAKDSEYKDGPVVGTTSALKSITKIVLTQAATGGTRGWKISVKGDGDTDWVEIHNKSIATASGEALTLDINRENVQIKFENFNVSQNAYMVDLDIYGMVDLSGAPLLGSFKANGTKHIGEEFEMNNDGNYEGTFELFKSETMISETNPITEATADNGEIGTVTYTGSADECKVTIPVTANGKTVNYIANFIRKPFLTLTYIGLDGQDIGTQKVEKDTEIKAFEIDINDVKATRDGYKARGWFKQNYVGAKYAASSIISEPVKLYAVETEIEVPSDSRKYEYDLTNQNFADEDHEGFNSIGNGKYYNNHGWVFSTGDKIELLVGKKATVSLSLCQYSADDKITASNGAEINSKVSKDGDILSFDYEGEAGSLTLTIGKGSTYIHKITVLNTTKTNYNKAGQWISVFPGDVSSFLDALDIANGTSGTDRVFIYLPNGTYDLGTTVFTEVKRNNISIIGEDRDKVIIKNTPVVEGIQANATIKNTSSNLYLQDLTIQNAFDYYSAGGKGVAVALWERNSNRTIAKNVKLLSYQDTYYSNSDNQFYFEDGEIHGCVDYVCGSGDVYYKGVTFVNESRSATQAKNGDATIAAPWPNSDAVKFGYIMDGCIIENGAKTFNFGRSWGGKSKLTYLNTVLNQPEEIAATRFKTDGMNTAAYQFKEYNTKDAAGNVISPATNELTFTHKDGNYTYETILSAEQAAEFAYSKVFPSWDPAAQAKQLEAPKAKLVDKQVTWDNVEGATAYLVTIHGLGTWIATENSFILTSIDPANSFNPAEQGIYVRAANSMGGFGPAGHVDGTSGVAAVKADVNPGEDVIYNLQGVRVTNPTKGIYIVNGRKVVIK